MSSKPPSILVFTDDNSHLSPQFETIRRWLVGGIVAADIYTVGHLLASALEKQPFDDSGNCKCVLVAGRPTPSGWARLRRYSRSGGKLAVFASAIDCQGLLAMLAETEETTVAPPLATLDLSTRSTPECMLVQWGEESGGEGRQTIATHVEVDLDEVAGERREAEEPSAVQLLAVCMTHLGVKCRSPPCGGVGTAQPPAPLHFPDATPTPTRGYMLLRAGGRGILGMAGLTYGKELGGGGQGTRRVQFQPSALLVSGEARLPPPSADLFPVEVRRRKEGIPSAPGAESSASFDSERFFSVLSTTSTRLGHTLVYVPVTETTMEVARSLSAALPHPAASDGMLIVAGIMTRGRGRGGNEWISPPGCAMFTAILKGSIAAESALGRSGAGYLQHILAVAVCDAVRRLDGLETFPIGIKWPNDIYYKRERKLGGILVTAHCMGDEQLEFHIAAGVNVLNRRPNGCIRDYLPADAAARISVEEVMAETLNSFEKMLELFQTSGIKCFLDEYYKYWIHSGEEVTVKLTNDPFETGEQVNVIGLDAHGYLQVRSRQTGEIFSVQDDGNTFDMMKGLIRPK